MTIKKKDFNSLEELSINEIVDHNLKIISHIDNVYKLLILTYGLMAAIITISYVKNSLSIFVICCIILAVTITYGYFVLIEWGGKIVGGNGYNKVKYLLFYYVFQTLFLILSLTILYYWYTHRENP